MHLLKGQVSDWKFKILAVACSCAQIWDVDTQKLMNGCIECL